MATVEDRVTALETQLAAAEASLAALQTKALALAAAAKTLVAALAPTVDLVHQQDKEVFPNGVMCILKAQKSALDAAQTAFDALD